MRMDLSGSAEPQAMPGLVQEVIRIVQAERVERLLVDVRGLEAPLGPVETLELIRDYPRDLETMRRRVAVLETPEQAAESGFHETAAQNRGHRVRHFTDRAQAEAWLFGEDA